MSAGGSACDAGYKAKCKQVERRIKEMIFLNAALENELRECRLNVATFRADRKILLSKLLALDKAGEASGGGDGRDLSNGASAAPAPVKKTPAAKSKATASAKSEVAASKRKKAEAPAAEPLQAPSRP